jgi:hypothetical protein
MAFALTVGLPPIPGHQGQALVFMSAGIFLYLFPCAEAIRRKKNFDVKLASHRWPL